MRANAEETGGDAEQNQRRWVIDGRLKLEQILNILWHMPLDLTQHPEGGSGVGGTQAGGHEKGCSEGDGIAEPRGDGRPALGGQPDDRSTQDQGGDGDPGNGQDEAVFEETTNG